MSIYETPMPENPPFILTEWGTIAVLAARDEVIGMLRMVDQAGLVLMGVVMDERGDDDFRVVATIPPNMTVADACIALGGTAGQA